MSIPTTRDGYREYVRDAVDAMHGDFSGQEVLNTHGGVKNGVANTLPPPSLLPRLVLVLAYAQVLRNRVGPLKLNSLYRTPRYNAQIRGARFSQHVAMGAADLKPLQASVSDLRAAAREVRGARLKLSLHATDVLRRLIRETGSHPFTGSVRGLHGPIACDPRALNVQVPAPQEGDGQARVTLIGGIGKYPTFVHVDLRGEAGDF